MPSQCTLTCQHCGTPFTVKPSRLGKARFCSRSCHGKSKVGVHPHNYRGGDICPYGYKRVYAPDGSRVFEHRLVWEQTHGPIPDGALIHHINGVRTDNRIANLQLLDSVSDHMLLHAYGAAREGWARGYDACTECGTTTRPHGGNGLCNRCYLRTLRGTTSLPKGSWSFRHERCIECGSTDRQHKGHGLRVYCYDKERRSHIM